MELMHKVEVWSENRMVGEILVVGDSNVEPIQLAATAAESLKSASFKVGGETFTQDEISEWWA